VLHCLTGSEESPTAVSVESAVRCEKLSVHGMETKPGRGWSEMVAEIPRCLTMQALVHNDSHLSPVMMCYCTKFGCSVSNYTIKIFTFSTTYQGQKVSES